MKKIIYTQRVEVIESYNERRDCADQRITDFILACGYLPIATPNNVDITRLIVNEVKPTGIFLVGGNSLAKYGGNAPERDATDMFLIDLAVKRRIPLYGFCRGMQSILDFFGNELVNVTGHVAVRHDIFGLEEYKEVNSYHNQGCVEITSKEIEVVMRAIDGTIEKIRHKTLPIIGTMWHPEREEMFMDSDILMIRELMGDR